MSSNNQYEEEQLFEILNLSPSQHARNLRNMDLDNGSREGPQIPDFQGRKNEMGGYSNVYQGNGDNGRGMEGTFLRNLNINLQEEVGQSIKAEGPEEELNDLLSPVNFSANRTLFPPSPSLYSSHSLYSENSLNPGSPYVDALSHISSNVFSDVGNRQNVSDGFLQGPNFYDSNNSDRFNNEIALGGSISSTALNHMFGVNDNNGTGFSMMLYSEKVASPQEYEGMKSVTSLHSRNGVDNTTNQLTENNLSKYNYHVDRNQNPELIISVQRAPEDIGAHTPSLFSNSSHSSVTNSPKPPSSLRTSGSNSLVPNSSYEISSPGSALSDYSDLGSQHLNPDEYLSLKRGRKMSHSMRLKSRLNSRTSRSDQSRKSEDESSSPASSRDALSTREKMLELASPNQPSRRMQKHPSVYACHICDKRFTRPYNLKSHLRTHTDERPFTCSVCGKAFARQHDRKRHEDLHTGEKKFQCRGFLKDGTPYGCGRKFARADALRRHFQTEAGKECIRSLIEEEERERTDHGVSEVDSSAPSSHQQVNNASASTYDDTIHHNIPQLAISPPE